MLFSSPFFLFLFFPLAVAGVLLSRGRLRDSVLLGFSALFYFWGEPRFFWLALASALADYLIGARIHANADSAVARRWLALGVTLNLLLLAAFKYLDFFIDGASRLLALAGAPEFGLLHLALPIGVSFIVFEKISYLVDIARGRAAPAPSLRLYLLYVLFFPKLLAGPIVKYHDFEPQLRAHAFDADDLAAGFTRFLVGLAKKVLIADSLGEIVAPIFSLPSAELGFGWAWLGAACFTLQIYFDFSGYSDMAIGMARMFGFRLMENFNLPYIAESFTEFWRRWHISLSTWIREYLYVPLGGNRAGISRTLMNLWICFLLSGLWHGAQWTYVLWGAWHGAMLTAEKLFWLKLGARLPRVLRIAITLTLVMLGFVIFRCDSLAHAGHYFAALSEPGRPGTYLYVTRDLWTALALAALLALAPVVPAVSRRIDSWREAMSVPRPVWAWGAMAGGMFALGKTVAVTFQPFFYFRF